MPLVNSRQPFLFLVAIVLLFTGCADHSPKAGEGSHADNGEVSHRIMVDHGVHRTALAKDLRSLLTEATRYVGKICVRLKSKCPEEPHKHLAEAESENSTSDGEVSESDDDSSDKENEDHQPSQSAKEGSDDDKESSEKQKLDSKDAEESTEEDEPGKHGEHKSVHNGDSEAISTTVEAGVDDESKHEQPREPELSKEANELLDVIFELGQSYPSLIPSLKEASTWIVEDYKSHESETADSVQLYIPFQLLRMYFDLVLKIKAQTTDEPLSPELLHVYSHDSFEILRSVMFYISKKRDPHFHHTHIPHEIQAMTKASKLLENLKTSSDDEEHNNIARRIVVKIFLGIADMFVLVRGTEHRHKLSTELLHLYDACVTHLESIPQTLDNHLMRTNELKNKIWMARSEIFKTGKLGNEHALTKLTETVNDFAKGKWEADGSVVNLLHTDSFTDTAKSSSKASAASSHEDTSGENDDEHSHEADDSQAEPSDDGSEGEGSEDKAPEGDSDGEGSESEVADDDDSDTAAGGAPAANADKPNGTPAAKTPAPTPSGAANQGPQNDEGDGAE